MKLKRVLKKVSRYAMFFLFVSFVTTCCMMLFLNKVKGIEGVIYNESSISDAAKITFLNVIFLSLIFTVFDAAVQRITVDRPVKKIINAAKRIADGDYNVRIPYTKIIDGRDGFDEIIDCFNKMAVELGSTQTLHSDFIANVSHEIKTPLAIIQNYCTLLRDPALPQEKREEYSAAMNSACKKLTSLITNILKLNKLENQTAAVQGKEYDLSEQLCESLLDFEEIWEHKQIELEADIQPQVLICSDPELWSIVWNNLISNALKFTEPGGKISLTLSANSYWATVKISDTGCGISAQTGKRIFDKFYQGDTSHSSKGNGLGLALVKRIINITGSDISVESELGKGSTFTVKIKIQGD